MGEEYGIRWNWIMDGLYLLNNVGYKGYISIEFEGNEAADTGVKKSVELLRKVLGK